MSSNLMPPDKDRTGSVIIFDSTTQTVSTKKHKHLKGQLSLLRAPTELMLNRVLASRVIKSQTAPKWRSYVDIYVGEEETKRLAATLNLDKLGWTTNMKRLCGKFSYIYVVEDDSRTSPLLRAS